MSSARARVRARSLPRRRRAARPANDNAAPTGEKLEQLAVVAVPVLVFGLLIAAVVSGS